MTKKHSLYCTLVAVDTIVRRPYKVNVEVRRSKEGYMVTLVSRGTAPVARAVKKLRELGYNNFSIYLDRYGFIRVHFRNLTYDDVLFIKKVVYDNLQPVPRKAKREVELLIAS